MSRTIQQIYKEAIEERNKRLELQEFKSDSKLSIMNGILWIVSAIIYSFEAILDTFVIDISNVINSRVNGTPNYYANVLLKYQKGDTLTVRDDGLAFGYNTIDETKRIITQVSYSESNNDVNLDNKMIYKVATGEAGKLSAIPQSELILISSYIRQFTFAGTRLEVTSREGDVLIPRVTVYYDGGILESEIYDNIDKAINEFIINMSFDSSLYVSKLLDAIKGVEHVTDVHIATNAVPEQGIFLACYDSDGYVKTPRKVERMTHTSSGFIKESTKKDQERDLPNFRESIKLVIDTGCDTDCLQTYS